MDARCKECDCLLHYEPEQRVGVWVSGEKRSKTWAAAFASADSEEERNIIFRRQIDALGQPDTWKISCQCPGCKSSGPLNEAFSEEEAKILAQKQNLAADTPEALIEARLWQENELRDAMSDADYFAEQFVERFSQHHHRHKFLPQDQEENEGIYFVALLRPIDPEIRIRVDVQLLRREVILTCNAWHTHFFGVNSGQSHKHIRETLDVIEDIISEKYQFATFLKEGKCCTSGTRQAPGQEQTWDKYASEADTIKVSSWLGTYQKTLTRPPDLNH